MIRRLLILTGLILSACGGENEVIEPVREPTAAEMDQARAFLDAHGTPLPDGWSFTRIDFDNEGFLRLGRAAPENPRGTVVFVPGYTSSPELASDFLTAWHDLGFEVAAMDLPGQGGSIRRGDDYQKTFTGDFSYYGRSVAAAVDHIEATRTSAGPLIVSGDSFGGHAILRAAHDGGLDAADGLFVLVPAVLPETGGTPLWLAKFMTGLAVRTGDGGSYFRGQGPWRPGQFNDEDYEFCGNRQDRNFKNEALYRLRPDLRVGGVSNEYVHGILTSGQELLRSKTLPEVDIPVTTLTAGLEVIVQNPPAERLCTQNMQTCELVRLEEATHCLYLEDEPTQKKVHQALLSLVDRVEARNRQAASSD